MAYETMTHDDMTVESSTETADQMSEAFAEPDPPVVPVADADPEPEPEPKPKPRNDPRARVEAATAKEAEAKRERDEAKAETAKLQTRIAELESRTAPKPVQKPVETAADAEPTVDQFDSYEKFVKAQARWEARQEIKQQTLARQEQEAKQQHEYANAEIERSFGERYAAVKADDPDFEAKVNPVLLNTPRVARLPKGQAATFDNFLVDQVFQSEQPKALLLHLSDPAVYQRLATLHPIAVIRELARFESGLAAASLPAPAVKVTPVSNAKAPIRPVASSPLHTADDAPDDDASVDKHIAYWNAADRKQRRG